MICLSEDVHAISRELHPSILKDLGLVRALNSLCISFAHRENIPVDFQSEKVPEIVPKDAALCIYRIVQESLRNVARHARARQATVLLRNCGNSLCLSVEDDGAGRAIKEIATILKISTRTVEFHKYTMMESLGLKSTAELIRYAVEHGIG